MNRNRIKLLYLNQDTLVQLFNMHIHHPQVISRPVCESLPDDAIVLAVNHSAEYRSLVAIVQHESFEEVEPGSMPPRLLSGCHTITCQELPSKERIAHLEACELELADREREDAWHFNVPR